MSVDCGLNEIEIVTELCDVQAATDNEIVKLQTYISNTKPEAEFTITARTLMSLLKRIKSAELTGE